MSEKSDAQDVTEARHRLMAARINREGCENHLQRCSDECYETRRAGLTHEKHKKMLAKYSDDYRQVCLNNLNHAKAELKDAEAAEQQAKAAYIQARRHSRGYCVIRCTWPVARSCCSRGPLPPNGGGGDRAPMGCSVQGDEARRLIGFLERGGRKLAPFQRRFVGGAMAIGTRKAILSGPRGLGKSSLSGELLAAAVHPDGPLFRPGAESVLLASSLEQARLCFAFLRRFVGEDGFRFQDSGQRVSCTHVPTHTRVRVASSDAKRAFGLGANTPIVVGDEPAAWLDRAGSLMYDALETSGGKADMRAACKTLGLRLSCQSGV